MKKEKASFNINIKNLVKKNRQVNTKQLTENLKVLETLTQIGIKIGANYSLGSPYIRPQNSESSVPLEMISS